MGPRPSSGGALGNRGTPSALRRANLIQRSAGKCFYKWAEAVSLSSWQRLGSQSTQHEGGSSRRVHPSTGGCRRLGGKGEGAETGRGRGPNLLVSGVQCSPSRADERGMGISLSHPTNTWESPIEGLSRSYPARALISASLPCGEFHVPVSFSTTASRGGEGSFVLSSSRSLQRFVHSGGP